MHGSPFPDPYEEAMHSLTKRQTLEASETNIPQKASYFLPNTAATI